jgi:drug/metabolite transporter (DMT)-like permease
MKAGFDAPIFSSLQFMLLGIFSIIAGVVFRLRFQVATAEAWAIIIFLALFPMASAFVVQLMAQKIMAPPRVSLILALDPVFAGLFAWKLGGELLLLRSAVGGFFIFAALLVSGIPVNRR